LPHIEIPEGLCELAKKMASPAMSPGEEFRPEAAIVNYYGPSMRAASLQTYINFNYIPVRIAYDFHFFFQVICLEAMLMTWKLIGLDLS
jgi:hypothetical protein